MGNQPPGFLGLQAGTQPPVGVYIMLPLYYGRYDLSIYDAQGDRILKDATAAANLYMLPALAVVTPWKLLGANVGFTYMQWIDNAALDQATLNFHRTTAYGFGDIYVQPAYLGWHSARSDVTVGYAFFAPTGSGTAGRHMWVHEVDFGGTLYLDAAKKYNVSTMVFYDFNEKKNNADIKVGDIMTWSGGIGRSFLKGAGNAGVAYNAQWKMTHDSGSDIPPLVPITDGRAFGVGPEIFTPVFAKGRNVGLVNFRYLWMLGPKTNFGGQVLSASFTFARLGL